MMIYVIIINPDRPSNLFLYSSLDHDSPVLNIEWNVIPIGYLLLTIIILSQEYYKSQVPSWSIDLSKSL